MIGPMIAFLSELIQLGHPVWVIFGLFALWMFIDAIRRREWLWAVFIFVFPILNAILYFFLVYRAFPRPGWPRLVLIRSEERRRIRELEARIHHLDKAHHHRELGDIYLNRGRLAKAEACYRNAIERDPDDPDTLARYGQCLLRQKKAAEAVPHLEKVCAQDPDHDYGRSLIALAESYAALKRFDDAIQALEQVVQRHSYASARVQLAELYVKKGLNDKARAELEEILSDYSRAPDFERHRDKAWIARARRLLAKL
ncbi:MAG: tetratricopeptide repeat protein [Verrucomicrobiae bacterium]|nr:tetratricopeptide repeat protein [Verrucomicrobiae bacterium]